MSLVRIQSPPLHNFMNESEKYIFKEDCHSSHGQVIALIPPQGQKILDIGCGPVGLARFLKKEGNWIAGIDQYADSFEDVSLDFKAQKDLEAGLKLDFGKEFDWILLMDVLEHLRQPEEILQEARNYLKKGGRLIISVPNVAHWSVRFSLLFGLFCYAEKGILDKTHLRFYTLKTFKQLLQKNSFKILKIKATPLPLLDLFPVFRYFPFRLVHWADLLLVTLRKTFFGYQFIFVAEDLQDCQ